MNYDLMVETKTVTNNQQHPGEYVGRHRCCHHWQLWLTCALVSTLICISGGRAQEVESLASVGYQLSVELVRYFPPVTGEVIKVEDKRVYIDLGAKDAVWTGLRLLVFRQGEALKHPTTGAVLGHDEQQLGQMTIVQVSENHSVGVYLPADENMSVQPGDNVRLTAGRIDVSLAPPMGPWPTNMSPTEVGAQLKDALEATGRFRVQGVERVNAWLLERQVAPEAAVEPPYLQMLTKSLNTPYLVQPVLKAAQGQSILVLRLLAATQSEPVAEASAGLSSDGAGVASTSPPGMVLLPTGPSPSAQNQLTQQDQYAGLFRQPLMMQPGGFPWNLAEGMTEIYRFEDELLSLDAGDPDGDGLVDVVMATESRVSLYQLHGQSLQLVDEVRTEVQGRIISAQLVHLGVNSPLGIVVNHQRGTEGIDSFVLALQGQKLAYWQQHIYETLLAVDSDGDDINDRIWGQPFDEKRFFRRDVVRVYLPENGELKFQNNLKVPYLFRATGAALVNLGAETETERHLTFIDERNHLQVYRGMDKLWESGDSVGGSYAEGQLPQGGEVDFLIGDAITNAYPFEPIPEPVDVDGDGVDEVLVIRNGASFGGVVPNRTRYATGDVALLRTGPYGYTLSPVSPTFDGMVSGLSVVRNPTAGILIAISRRQGILGRKRQTIVFLNRLPLS